MLPLSEVKNGEIVRICDSITGTLFLTTNISGACKDKWENKWLKTRTLIELRSGMPRSFLLDQEVNIVDGYFQEV